MLDIVSKSGHTSPLSWVEDQVISPVSWEPRCDELEIINEITSQLPVQTFILVSYLVLTYY